MGNWSLVGDRGGSVTCAKGSSWWWVGVGGAPTCDRQSVENALVGRVLHSAGKNWTTTTSSLPVLSFYNLTQSILGKNLRLGILIKT